MIPPFPSPVSWRPGPPSAAAGRPRRPPARPVPAGRPWWRCVLTTIDQRTAQNHPTSEPLRTLATYRNAEGGTMFGQNVTGPGQGRLRLGDALTVGSRK